MRSVKFVQFAVGFVAAGGAVVLLGGSAFAADSGATTGLPASNSHLHQQGSPTGVTGQAPSGGDSNQTSTPLQPSTPTVGTGGDNPSSADPPSGTDTNSNQQQTSSTPTDQNTNGIVTGSSPQSGTGGPTATTTENSPSAHPSALADSGQSAGPSVSIGSGAQVSTPVIIFRSAALAVQPTIVNHESQDTDLASTMPTAPAPARAPAPPKSNGALGSIAAVLAGTVVPQPFMPALLPTDRIKLLLSLVTLVMLLGSLVILSYGLWLRRGGYATAARSDSPIIGNISPFATPLLMGYASAPPRLHSPSLVVSDYKSKALFPTLSERRRGI